MAFQFWNAGASPARGVDERRRVDRPEQAGMRQVVGDDTGDVLPQPARAGQRRNGDRDGFGPGAVDVDHRAAGYAAAGGRILGAADGRREQ